MVNYGLRLVASFTLVLSLLRVPLSASAEGITVVESRADHSFAQQITFTLRAASEAEITDVYLFFRATGDEQAKPVPLDIAPGREIALSYAHDLRRSPLSPFAQVSYWWRIKDGAGNELTTEPQSFEYTDNRFSWKHLSDGGMTVHWIEEHGDPVFAQAALDIARASLEEINAELRAPLPESIDIYIYDTQPNLDAAMVLTGREWVVGQAHPELGVVIVAIPYQEATPRGWGATSRTRSPTCWSIRRSHRPVTGMSPSGWTRDWLRPTNDCRRRSMP